MADKLSIGGILPSKILVKQLEEPQERVTQAGLIIPNLNKKNPTIVGEIVMVGQGSPQQPMVLSVGKKILFPPLSAQLVMIDDVEYRLLDQTSVLFFW
jgi:co-chaperonin GroES (HSP10)